MQLLKPILKMEKTLALKMQSHYIWSSTSEQSFRNEYSVQLHWLKKCFLSRDRDSFYLSACSVCFLVKRRIGPRIPLSSHLLLPLQDPFPQAVKQSLVPHCSSSVPPSHLPERDRDLRCKCALRWLSRDSSMLIFTFITLYGIPLVVTKRHVSFER